MNIQRYTALVAIALAITFLGGNVFGQSSLLPSWGDLQNTQNSRINAARIDALARSSRRPDHDARAVRSQLAGICTITVVEEVESEGSGDAPEATTTVIEPSDSDPCPAWTEMQRRMDSGEFVSPDDIQPYVDMASAGCMVLNPTEAEEHDPCPRASRINARVAALEANDELQDQEIENLQIANRNRYLSRDRVLFQGGAMVGYGFDAAAIAGAGWDHPLACNVRGECGGRFVLAAHFGWDRQDPSIGVTMEVGRLLRERLTLGGFIGYHRDFGADDPFPESQTLLTGVSAEIFKGVERRVSLVINAGYCGTDDDGTWRDGAGGNIVIRLRP